jgi:cell division protein FtsL
VAWRAIGGSIVAATLLIGLLLPGAYRTLAGYQIDELKRTRDQAVRELRTLEYQEANLINMDRVNELARKRDFAAPSGDQVQFLQPKDSVASLRKP